MKIKDSILKLTVKPGITLTESEISKELNLGKSPVREALKRLENEDLVASIAYNCL